MLSLMYGAVINCSRDITSFIQWDGMHSVFRLRTMRSRWEFIRQNQQQQNITNIKRQINDIAALYDWDMEVNTTDPEFLQMDTVDLCKDVQRRSCL